MSTYGAKMIPDDGGKEINITSDVICPSFCQSITLVNGQNSYPIANARAGSTFLALPRKIYYQDSNYLPQQYSLRSISFSDTNMNVETDTYSNITIDVFQCLPRENTSLYGIFMQNSTNFMAIDQESQIGFVTYRGIVNVSPEWQIPDSIPNRSSCLVYARWDNTQYTLFLDRSDMKLKAYNDNNGQQNGTINNVQVVIVSSGFSPGLPASNYGIVIRNRNNQITFSNKYPAFIWRGATWSSPGNVGDWQGFSGNVQWPMIPLYNAGCKVGVESGGSNQWGTWRMTLSCGLKMNAQTNQVCVQGGPRDGNDAIEGYSFNRVAQGIVLPVIDAADYF